MLLIFKIFLNIRLIKNRRNVYWLNHNESDTRHADGRLDRIALENVGLSDIL